MAAGQNERPHFRGWDKNSEQTFSCLMLRISFPYTDIHTYSPISSSNYCTFQPGNITDFTLHCFTSPLHYVIMFFTPSYLIFSHLGMFTGSLLCFYFILICVCPYFQVTSSCSLIVPSSVMSTNISCGLATKKSALAHVTMPTSSQPKPFASVTCKKGFNGWDTCTHTANILYTNTMKRHQ